MHQRQRQRQRQRQVLPCSLFQLCSFLLLSAKVGSGLDRAPARFHIAASIPVYLYNFEGVYPLLHHFDRCFAVSGFVSAFPLFVFFSCATNQASKSIRLNGFAPDRTPSCISYGWKLHGAAKVP